MLRSFLISALICGSFASSENIDVELLTVNETDIEHKSFKHDIKRMPESITFRVRSDSGRNAILRLVKIPPLPTYAIKKGRLSVVKNQRQDLAAYKDDSCKAVILVTRHPQSLHYTLEGHLQIGLKLIHIKPTEDGSRHILVNQETLLHYTPAQHHRGKRSLKVYTVEVGFVADYENFFSFFGRNNNNVQLAEAEMRNYYAFIAEKMKVRYHHINEVDGTIAFDVVTSGLVIIEDRVDSWFTENIKTGRVVEAEEALNATRYASLPAGIILPDSDHFMFFTGYDLAHAESLANAGRAYTGVMCREYNGGVSKSHSIVEDHRDGETGTTASHELGHALNANHDSDVGCSDVNRYIMAASSNPIFDAALAQRPWQFSTCSVRDMKTYVERSDVNCLDDNRYSTGVVSSAELAGQYFSRDEQCAMKLGTNATFCAFPYQTDKDKLCYLGWCAYPNQPFNCTSSKYMEYTTCDTGRWCHRGLCIKANNTAPVFVNIPTGSVDIGENAQGAVYTVQTYDPDVGDVMNFDLTWDPVSAAGFFVFNQISQQVSIKPGLHLKTDGFTLTNFSLILSVDDGLLRSLPANIDFKIIADVNHPPVFTNPTYSVQINEGKAGDVVIPSLLSSVSDQDNSIITFSLLPTTSSSYFTINPSTGRIQYAKDYDTDPTGLSASVILTVQATDQTSLSAIANFNLTIRNVNQAPRFLNLPGVINIAEALPSGASLYTIRATDPDSTDTLTYNFINPSSFVNTYLNLNSQTGLLTFTRTQELDYETQDPKSMIVTISVGNNFHSINDVLTVNVVNSNEPPYFSRSSYNVTTTTGPAERIIVNRLVNLVQDPDLTDTTFTYSIQNELYSNYFKIDQSSGQISFAVKYGTDRTTFPSVVALIVIATDSAGLKGTATYVITINLAEVPPVITNLPSSVSVNENTATGRTLFIVTSEDINPGDIITYMIETVNFNTQLFTINNNGVVSVSDDSILDYESLPSVISVRITAFDGALFSTPAILTVNLLNVNEAPVFTQTQYNFNVYGSKAGQVVISSLTQFAIDPDQNDVLTFLIVPSNPNFYINPSTGAISFTSDYPSTSAKQITLPVVVQDLRNMNGLTNVTVTVIEVNQPPVLTNLPQMIQVLENTPPGTTIFTVSSQDADAGDTITYTMQTVNTATQLFSINSAGVISVKSGIILDFESLPSVFYLTIRVFDGQLYSTPANLTIQLLNVNEAPRFNQSQYSFTVNEGKAGQILVPSLLTYIIDEDANEQFRFSLVAGSSSNTFRIDQSTGAVRFSADYDTDPNRAPSQVMLDVLVRDTGLSFSTGKIILNINNVNQAPVFTNLPSEVQISSDTSAGTVVFTVSFSDPDSLDTLTLNGVFTNSISGNSFSFNQFNGELKYLGIVSIPRHVLQCTLSDGKITTTAQLTILVYQDPQVTTTLVPTTTTAPRDLVITNLPQTITVAENVNSGTIVFNVTTSDAVTSSLSFQLQHLNTGDLFAINNAGAIYVTNRDVLDYESLPTLIYLTITANNGVVSSNPVNMTVRLSNVNEPPKFNQTLYSFIIGDPKLGEDLTQTLIPYINDPTDKLFSLASTTNSQYFTINPFTGAIRLANNPPILPKKVDLTVVVQDSSLGGQAATAVISLFMNLPPRFTNLPSTVTIPSDTRPGDAIFTLQTTDPNPGDILTVRFLTSQSKFGLGSITNAVFVQSGSSFPTNESYTMEFSVSDGQKLVSSVLTVHVYIPAKTVTEIPTSQTTKPIVVDPKTTTSNPATDSGDNLPLLERPWAITAIIITAVLVPTLIIFVAVIICRRRNGHDDRSSSNEKIYDHRSNRSLPLSFYPSYNRGKSVYQTHTYPHNFN